jgi:putative proteasome-type protease
MTFCLGMKVRDGLLAIADTRITSGTETSIAKKITVYQGSAHSMFILTSGLRSVRDKAITYFQERLLNDGSGIDRMYKAANLLSEEIRRVRKEDERWLEEGGLQFDLNCIFGGQLEADDEPRLYLIYAEGNWVEVTAGTPYVIIGDSRYGKPLLDRALSYESPVPDAFRDGLLAFDATRTSATDVDYPIDVVLYRAESFQMREQRYTREDLQPVQEFWQAALLRAAAEADAFVAPLFEALDESVTVANEA